MCDSFLANREAAGLEIFADVWNIRPGCARSLVSLPGTCVSKEDSSYNFCNSIETGQRPVDSACARYIYIKSKDLILYCENFRCFSFSLSPACLN